MRKTILLSSLLLLFAAGAQAQATHQVTLTWVLSTDDNTISCTALSPCSQNVYRTLGACTPTTVFASPLANISATAAAYTDLAVSPGQTYCYAVTFVDNTGESPILIGVTGANSVTAKVLPFPPTNLAETPK